MLIFMFFEVSKYGRGGAPGLATYLCIGSNLEIL